MLHLVFDYTSLACAVSALRLHTRMRATPDAVTAVRFSGIAQMDGTDELPVTIQLLDEWQRWQQPARELGLVAHRPLRAYSTFSAHVLGDIAEKAGFGMAWREAVFTAYFTHRVNVGDRGVLTELASSIGLEPTAVAAAFDDTMMRGQVRQRMARVRQLGIRGVPILDIDGTMVPATIDDEALDALFTMAT